MEELMIYQALAELERNNGEGTLCTVVRSQGSTPRRENSKMLVYADGRTLGSVGGGEMESRVIAEAHQAMLDGKSRLLTYQMSDPQRGDPGVCGGQVEIFVEPIHPRPTLLVVGGGHVGKAVTHLAKWLGFRVFVNDDRPEYCTPEAVPGADGYYPISMKDLLSQVRITPHTYVVLTTRNVDVDLQGLPDILETSAAYIGVIGSKRRWDTTRKKLLEVGVSKERIGRVHSPIGLELNAETPEEIALSIMAEVVMRRRGGDGSTMKAD